MGGDTDETRFYLYQDETRNSFFLVYIWNLPLKKVWKYKFPSSTTEDVVFKNISQMILTQSTTKLDYS